MDVSRTYQGYYTGCVKDLSATGVLEEFRALRRVNLRGFVIPVALEPLSPTVPRGSMYTTYYEIMELGPKDHPYYGFRGLIPLS